MKHIAIFSGNRAEFGILFPIISELSKEYKIDILLSGAHVLPQWNTYKDVIAQLDAANLKYSLYRINLREEDAYVHSMATIYDWTLDYYKSHSIDYGFALGDRIESFGFALATFYSRVPLVHFCGGDIVQVSNFDTNARHSITKLANYHMVTSEISRAIVLQLGEEPHRVLNIGNPSFDYERMGFLPSKEDLLSKYSFSEKDMIGIMTFHPSASRTIDENLNDFETVLQGVLDSNLSTIFVSYPNNDPGHEKLIGFIKEFMDKEERLRTVKSFGTFNYLGMMKHFKTIIVGNSSSGLLETPYYMVPTVNIGDRQKDRIRSNNVIDCAVDQNEIALAIDGIIHNYESLKRRYKENRFIFGDGNAAEKVKHFMKELDSMTREEKLFKKFVIR